MSNSKKDNNVNRVSSQKVYFYENLPSGGAKKLAIDIYENYSGNKSLLIGYKKIPKNIFQYLYYSIIKSYVHDKYLSNNVRAGDVFICFQSWLIKSPYILSLVKANKIVYICHESMREYYDSEIMSIKKWKNHIIDIIRYPIKIIDILNIKKQKINIIANSKYGKKLIFNSYGLHSEVIYPGIDIDKLNSKFLKRSWDNTKYQVICVGAINKLKRQDFIVRSLSNIPHKIRPNLVLVCNGKDDEYLREILDLATGLKVKVIIKENISNNDLYNEYLQSRAFIYAPLNEPFGLVVLEAMCIGLPVIAYKNGGGYAEVLERSSNIIINNLNQREWAEEIQKIIMDKGEWEIIGKANNQIAQKYSIQEYIKNLKRIIHRI